MIDWAELHEFRSRFLNDFISVCPSAPLLLKSRLQIQSFLAVFVFSPPLHLAAHYLSVCGKTVSSRLFSPSPQSRSFFFFFQISPSVYLKCLVSLWSDDLTSTPTWSWLNRLMAACHPSAQVHLETARYRRYHHMKVATLCCVSLPSTFTHTVGAHHPPEGQPGDPPAT